MSMGNVGADEAWRFKDLTGLDGVVNYMVGTTDGFVRAHSPALERDSAERVSAAVSATYSVNSYFAEFFGKDHNADHESLSLLLERPGDGYVAIVVAQRVAYLAVCMTFEANVSNVVAEMQKMVTKLPAFVETVSRVSQPSTS